jgi:hypothetical protein
MLAMRLPFMLLCQYVILCVRAFVRVPGAMLPVGHSRILHAALRLAMHVTQPRQCTMLCTMQLATVDRSCRMTKTRTAGRQTQLLLLLQDVRSKLLLLHGIKSRQRAQRTE